MAEPMIVIGEVNAAAQPFFDGSATIARYCWTTCDLTVDSHSSGVRLVGAWKAAPRSAIGSVIEGRVWKNSTPATKSFSVRPNGG